MKRYVQLFTLIIINSNNLTQSNLFIVCISFWISEIICMFWYICMYLSYLICAIYAYDSCYNICTYFYNSERIHNNIIAHICIYIRDIALCLTKRYNYPVKGWAPILMSICDPGLLPSYVGIHENITKSVTRPTSGTRRPAGRSGLTSPRQLISRMHHHL